MVGWRDRLWIILPWTISAMLLPDFWAYFSSFSLSTLAPVFLFGAMWGIGNINYGLTMRYLGMSMGIGIAIGITLIVGTLMTPIINGNFDVLINTSGGRMTLLGVLVALIGVGIVTRAGQLKERKMGIKAEDFNLKKRAGSGRHVRYFLRRDVLCDERGETDARCRRRAGRRSAVCRPA